MRVKTRQSSESVSAASTAEATHENHSIISVHTPETPAKTRYFFSLQQSVGCWATFSTRFPVCFSVKLLYRHPPSHPTACLVCCQPHERLSPSAVHRPAHHRPTANLTDWSFSQSVIIASLHGGLFSTTKTKSFVSHPMIGQSCFL